MLTRIALLMATDLAVLFVLNIAARAQVASGLPQR